MIKQHYDKKLYIYCKVFKHFKSNCLYYSAQQFMTFIIIINITIIISEFMIYKSDVRKINKSKKIISVQRCQQRHKKIHKQKEKEKQRIKIYDVKTQTKETEVKTVFKKITLSFITIDMLLNKISYIYILVNLKCLCFNMIIKKTVKQNKLKQFSVLL